MYELMKRKFKPELLKIPIPERDGILELMSPEYACGENKKFMKMYNWMSIGYDFVEQQLGKIKYKNKIKEMRKDMISELEWKNGARVLVVSIGTGRDLDFIPSGTDLKTLDLTGIDISMGMLKKCKRKWRAYPNFLMIHGCAEDLPFKNNQFDIVFHVGGINFFNDKVRAIKEMLRVARKNTKLMIADETDILVDELYNKTIFAGHYIGNQQVDLSHVESCIPKNVCEKKTKLLWDGKFYCITFRKP